jgi:hypothetical protein
MGPGLRGRRAHITAVVCVSRPTCPGTVIPLQTACPVGRRKDTAGRWPERAARPRLAADPFVTTSAGAGVTGGSDAAGLGGAVALLADAGRRTQSSEAVGSPSLPAAADAPAPVMRDSISPDIPDRRAKIASANGGYIMANPHPSCANSRVRSGGEPSAASQSINRPSPT